MTTENLLKNLITSRYKSVRNFSRLIDVPYTTVDSIFKRGIMKSGVTLMLKICDYLCIDIYSLAEGKIRDKMPDNYHFSQKEFELVKAYRTNPSMQPAVDTLLGIKSDTADVPDEDHSREIGKAIAEDYEMVAKKNTVHES